MPFFIHSESINASLMKSVKLILILFYYSQDHIPNLLYLHPWQPDKYKIETAK